MEPTIKVPATKFTNWQIPVTDGHRFGVDWNASGYVFYTDGKEVNRVNGPVSNVEQFILISTECMGYRNLKNPGPDPLLKKMNLPEYFEVDFVRVFDEISPVK